MNYDRKMLNEMYPDSLKHELVKADLNRYIPFKPDIEKYLQTEFSIQLASMAEIIARYWLPLERRISMLNTFASNIIVDENYKLDYVFSGIEQYLNFFDVDDKKNDGFHDERQKTWQWFYSTKEKFESLINEHYNFDINQYENNNQNNDNDYLDKETQTGSDEAYGLYDMNQIDDLYEITEEEDYSNYSNSYHYDDDAKYDENDVYNNINNSTNGPIEDIEVD